MCSDSKKIIFGELPMFRAPDYGLWGTFAKEGGPLTIDKIQDAMNSFKSPKDMVTALQKEVADLKDQVLIRDLRKERDRLRAQLSSSID